MSEENPPIIYCQQCGKVMAVTSPGGVCPRCLMGGILGDTDGSLAEDEAGVTAESQPVPESQATTTINTPEGTKIGRYKILQLIGEGGFGLVYMAEQVQSVNRRVALKIIKTGMDTKQVIARFEAERQALAMMDHLNIARVLDAGETDEGRPYFVMELVKGVPITTYCHDEKLDTKTRLDLFMQVCHAVHHAHLKGIIHRDLKPSNILVTLHDGKPIPKVIDFGIAKAIDTQLTDKTLFTRYEQMIGTPAYMSPEQAALSGLDVDTRSDVYALGVLLYELLTGSTPLDAKTMREAAFDEMRRMIREDEPPKPSTRLITLNTHQQEPGAANLVPRDTSIPQDLDWVAMKALEKDRARRYESPAALARDVERFRNDEPVEAGAPSIGYRASKFFLRHRVAVLVGSLAIAAILTGAVLGITGLSRALTANEAAEREAAIAAAVNAFLTEDLLARANPYNAPGEQETSLKEVLDRAAEKVDERFSDQPEVQASLHYTLGLTYNGIGALESAEIHARKASSLFRSTYGVDHVKTLEADSLLANVRSETDPKEGIERFQSVWQGRRKTLGDDHPATLRTQARIADLRGAVEDSEEAVRGLREVLAIQQKVLGAEHEDSTSTQQKLVRRLFGIGNSESREEAIMQGRDLLARLDACCGEDNPKRLFALHYLATMLGQGQRDHVSEAIPLHRQALEKKRKLFGFDHPETLASLGNLGQSLSRLGRRDEAIPLIQEKLELDLQRYGEEHESSLTAMNNLAVAYAETGRHQEAIDLFEKVIPLAPSVLGENHGMLITALDGLGGQYSAIGEYEKAIELSEAAYAKAREKQGLEDKRTLLYASHSASRMSEAGRHEKAEKRMREVCDIADRVHGSEHTETANYLVIFGGTLMQQLGRLPADKIASMDKTKEMLNCYERALEIQVKAGHPDIEKTRSLWVLSRKASGQSITEEEEKLLRQHFANKLR